MNTEKKKVKNTSFMEECLSVPTLSLWWKKKKGSEFVEKGKGKKDQILTKISHLDFSHYQATQGKQTPVPLTPISVSKLGTRKPQKHMIIKNQRKKKGSSAMKQK